MTGALELSPIPSLNDNNNTTLNTRNLNANGAQYAMVFQAPKSGEISEIGFYLDSIVGTPGQLLVQLNSPSSTGTAGGGTLREGSVSSAASLSTGTNFIALSSPYTVSRGSWYGINVRASTTIGTWDGSNRILLRWNYNVESPTGSFHYSAPYGASGSAKLGGCGFLSFKYSDNTIYGFPAVNRELFSPAGSGTAYGNIFKVPSTVGSMKVIGMAIITANPVAIDGTVLTYRLHTRSGTTATTVETQSITTSRNFGNQAGNTFRRVIYFDNEETVNGGTDIIASFETSVATNSIWRFNYENDDLRKAMTPWMEVEGCSIDTTTNAITLQDTVYFISLLVKDFTAASGSGGGIPAVFGGSLDA